MIENVLIICVIASILFAFVMIRNINTFRCHNKIDTAIYEYKLVCIRNHNWGALHFVEYKDEEHYIKTFWRLWDWGYTRILPIDKFEIIKPYIK